jgi:hypothetical protein
VTDSILWVTNDIAVNIDLIALVQIAGSATKIAFSTGEMIILEGDDSERFAKYLRQKFDRTPTPSVLRGVGLGNVSRL